jgi:hypothetical protein
MTARAVVAVGIKSILPARGPRAGQNPTAPRTVQNWLPDGGAARSQRYGTEAAGERRLRRMQMPTP